MSKRRQNDSYGVFVMLLSAFLGLLVILIATLVSVLSSKIKDYVVGIVAAVVHIGLQAALFYLTRHRMGREEFENGTSFNALMSEVVRNMDAPVVFTMVDGRIIWANNAMLELVGKDNRSEITGHRFDKYCDRTMAEIFSATKPEGIEISIGERSFRTLSYLMEREDRDYWMTVLDETTEVRKAEAEIQRVAPAIGFAVIDNAEDIAQYAKASYRAAASEIEQILREWTEGLGGFMHEYDRDKYIVVFPSDRLSECIADEFSVIDRARAAGGAAGSIALTVSMGICDSSFSITERGKAAAAALETALQRGGDQVVLRTGNDTLPFGGKTKVAQKRSKISSRVVSERLIQLLSDAGNVLIMGHKNPDFDSIGGCIGIARLARRYNGQVKIVMDKRNTNFAVSTEELLANYPDYSDVFISASEGQNLIRSDTLVIVCDVNNLKIAEAPEIITNTDSLVIIDHHLKIKDFNTDAEIAYIDPAASSCCELISEILQLSAIGDASPEDGGLLREEANVMLAGIMLDTRNFTRSTNEGTFSAALYLRRMGAGSEVAGSFFADDFKGYVSEAKLGSNVKLYRGCIAVTVLDVDGEITSENRVSASRAAESLLRVKQVSAAFALVRTDNAVLISARSDGSINVQLILEKMGGGGRFDAAGAQLEGKSAREVMEELKEAIDGFMDSQN